MTQLPDSVQYVVVGAGIHGLSTAWHLAMELERRKRGIQKSRTLEEMAGRKPTSPDAPRFATSDRNW